MLAKKDTVCLPAASGYGPRTSVSAVTALSVCSKTFSLPSTQMNDILVCSEGSPAMDAAILMLSPYAVVSTLNDTASRPVRSSMTTASSGPCWQDAAATAAMIDMAALLMSCVSLLSVNVTG